jgi:hypothetical protein
MYKLVFSCGHGAGANDVSRRLVVTGRAGVAGTYTFSEAGAGAGDDIMHPVASTRPASKTAASNIPWGVVMKNQAGEIVFLIIFRVGHTNIL